MFSIKQLATHYFYKNLNKLQIGITLLVILCVVLIGCQSIEQGINQDDKPTPTIQSNTVLTSVPTLGVDNQSQSHYQTPRLIIPCSTHSPELRYRWTNNVSLFLNQVYFDNSSSTYFWIDVSEVVNEKTPISLNSVNGEEHQKGSISPNGDYVVFISDYHTSNSQYTGTSIHLQTESEINFLFESTSQTGLYIDVQWYSNDQFMLFKQLEDSLEIELVRVDGLLEKTIKIPLKIHAIAWNSPSQTFAFVSEVQDSEKGVVISKVYIANFNEPDIQLLLEVESFCIGNFQWTPNGKGFVWTMATLPQDFSRLNQVLNDIFLFDIDTKTVQRITDSQKSYSEPTWSPDGQTLAYVAQVPTVRPRSEWVQEICLHQLLNGDITCLRNLEDEFRSTPVWTPDGTSITYIGEQDKERYIATVNLETGFITYLIKLPPSLYAGFQ